MLVLGVYREEIFSPGRVEDDKQIMDATLSEMRSRGHATLTIKAEAFERPLPDVRCVLTMAQSRRALSVLEEWSKDGAQIINAPSAVHACRRTTLIQALDTAGLPLPPGEIVSLETGNASRSLSLPPFRHYWLKRGDVHRVLPGDVVKVTSDPELAQALDHFRSHRIPKIIVQDHLEGEVIKFYGIRGGYFAGFGESGDGAGRFSELRSIAKRAAEAVGLEVYGGDAVITPDGRTVLIDLNAWPSFSRCYHNAARGIAGYVADVIAGALPPVKCRKPSEEQSSSIPRPRNG